MPHAEVSYSSDLQIDFDALFRGIEATLWRHDPKAGECKGRAYPAEIFRHSHCLLSLSMLSLPYRDEAFTQALLADAEDELRKHLSAPCYLTVSLSYSGPNYVTTTFP